MDEFDHLLRRGGWELVDPAPVAAEHPETFMLPSPEELVALGPGNRVRVTVRTATIADPVRDRMDSYDQQGRPVLVPILERMWAIVIERDGDLLECALEGYPFGTHTRLLPMDRIRIPVGYVIATTTPVEDFAHFSDFLAEFENDPARPQVDPSAPVDPLEPPRLRNDQQAVVDRTGAPGHPPLPFARVLLSRNVTPESVPLYGMRSDPRPERGDCGWTFFTGPPDLDQVAETVGFDIVTVQEAVGRHRGILAYLAMAPGWAFSLFDDGDDVYPVD